MEDVRRKMKLEGGEALSREVLSQSESESG